jgi:hypothetical protein
VVSDQWSVVSEFLPPLLATDHWTLTTAFTTTSDDETSEGS